VTANLGNQTLLRGYQIEAINRWTGAGRRGIWEMATGTGKTLTALEAVAPLVNAGCFVVVIVPGKDLVDQWSAAIKRHNRRATIVPCSSEIPSWRQRMARVLMQRHLRPDERRPTFLVATAATASSDDFRGVLAPVRPDDVVVVGDEVHRLGASSWRRAMDINAGAGRLGLSATPQRKWDEAGNRAIARYFGDTVFSYPLEQALTDGWLCPYEYHVLPVGLEPDERAAYLDLTTRISKLVATLADLYNLPPDSFREILRRAEAEGNNSLEMLLFERADLIKGAVGKLAVVEHVAALPQVDKCLVYCNEEPQVDQALSVLRAKRRRAVGYTASRLEGVDRSIILREFSDGVYEFAVAIRCLDEGIDIPDCRQAVILASSKTEREWIQRRGRVLRLAPRKVRAVVYDCIVVPSRLDEDGDLMDRINPVEVAILEGEIARAREFAGASLNMPETIAKLEDLRRKVFEAAGLGLFAV